MPGKAITRDLEPYTPKPLKFIRSVLSARKTKIFFRYVMYLRSLNPKSLNCIGRMVGFAQASTWTKSPQTPGQRDQSIGLYWDTIGVILAIMENKMETTIVYWGYIGIGLGFGFRGEGFIGFRDLGFTWTRKVGRKIAPNH